ncbi:MAG: ATPase, partial [Cyclobacteriaceae bacterium]
QAIQQLQKENSLLEQKKESFTEESERIREKSEQIQKIMNELLDEETKKLFQELEKLLKENADPSQMQKLLDKMDRKEINMEKELERTLELFKQLQYDYKLEQAIAEIKEQKEKQENLLQKTQELAGEKPEPKENGNSKDGKENKDGKQNENNPDKSKDNSGKENEGKENEGKKNDESQNNEKPSAEKLAEEQEQLKKENERFKETVKELEKMGEELDEAQDTPSDQQMQELDQSQEQSKEELKNGKPKKASEQQKKAVEQMKKMQQKLEGMQNSMEMEMDMANLESLRQILHGLIKLSFDQENLMKEFNQVQQTDPRYVTLSQQQLKVKDDAKVLEDSLLALSKKDAFLGSVVTKEVGDLNDHLDKAALNVKERRKGNASSEMQFSMTSINNLALLLNDHFDMMMDMMANAKPGKGKKKGKQKMPNLGQMQQQLNQQMEQMKKGGKSGRQLSEEFARMAAEQERIRRALQEMQEKLKQEGGKVPGGDLPGKMEQTEMDLVNKQITEQTIRRQNEIITRLLEAEKSMREQNQDQERKGETAKDYTQEIPRAFEEYLRLKEKEVELLKTVPPRLFPYYKKEVNEYFKRIGTKE